MVIRWFIHHSFALGILNKEQLSLSSTALTLFLPVITRWTAHYCSISRLLQLQKPIQVTVIKHEDQLVESVGSKRESQEKARRIVEVVKDGDFGGKLYSLSEIFLLIILCINLST